MKKVALLFLNFLICLTTTSNAQDILFNGKGYISGMSNVVLYNGSFHYAVLTQNTPNKGKPSNTDNLVVFNEKQPAYTLLTSDSIINHCVLKVSGSQLLAHFLSPSATTYLYNEYYATITNGIVNTSTIAVDNWLDGSFESVSGYGYHFLFNSQRGYIPTYVYEGASKPVQLEPGGEHIYNIKTDFSKLGGFWALTRYNLEGNSTSDLVLYRLFKEQFKNKHFIDSDIKDVFDLKVRNDTVAYNLYSKGDQLKLAIYAGRNAAGPYWNKEFIFKSNDPILEASLCFRSNGVPVIAYRTKNGLAVLEKDEQNWSQIYSLPNNLYAYRNGLSVLEKEGSIYVLWADSVNVYSKNVDQLRTKIIPNYLTIAQPLLKNKSTSLRSDFTENKDGLKLPLQFESEKRLKSGEINILGFRDWSFRDSPIRDQGQCADCWAMAATGLVENLLSSKEHLSTQNLLDSVVQKREIDNSCKNGWPGYALRFCNESGLWTETEYGKVKTPSYLAKIQKYNYFALWGDDVDINLLESMLDKGPVIVTFLVTPKFQAYTSGIYNYHKGEENEGTSTRHSVLCVGYDHEKQYFKCKNSWGSSWGEKGYFRIGYDCVKSPLHFGSYALTASDAYRQQDRFTVRNESSQTLFYTLDKDSRIALDYYTFSLVPHESKTITAKVIDWTLFKDKSTFTKLKLNKSDHINANETAEITVNTISNGISTATHCNGTQIESIFYIETAQYRGDGKDGLKPGDELEFAFGDFKKIIIIPDSGNISLPIPFFICSDAVPTSPSLSYRKQGSEAIFKTKVFSDSVPKLYQNLQNRTLKNKTSKYIQYLNIQIYPDDSTQVIIPDSLVNIAIINGAAKKATFALPVILKTKDKVSKVVARLKIPASLRLQGINIPNGVHYRSTVLQNDEVELSIEADSGMVLSKTIAYLSVYPTSLIKGKIEIRECVVNNKPKFSHDSNIGFSLKSVTNINLITGYSGFKVYPNPSKGAVKIIFEGNKDQTYDIIVTNLLGVIITKKDKLESSIVYSVDLPQESGVYFVKVVQSGEVFKIVRE